MHAFTNLFKLVLTWRTLAKATTTFRAYVAGNQKGKGKQEDSWGTRERAFPSFLPRAYRVLIPCAAVICDVTHRSSPQTAAET